MNAAAIKRIEAIFDRYCFGYHLFLKDHNTGEAYESGDRRSYPIGSCFKFAVAHASFAKLEKKEQPPSFKLELEIGSKMAGASILAQLSGQNFELEIQQLVELMISTSDGLATDRLIEWLGLDAVNESLSKFGPSSSLPLNLNDMVQGVWTLSTTRTVKSDEYSADESHKLLDLVVEYGATNAEDLASIAVGCSFPRFSSVELNENFQRAMLVERYIPRCEMFFGPLSAKCISKTGSLLNRYFMNDHGVFFDTETGEPFASFAYCSHGWKLPALTCETVGGLIGLEIATAFELDPQPNSNWSPQTEALFLDGI